MRETDGWIVMMTDFGADNIGTAAMKGVAASVDESLRLEDLTHSIEPFNVWQASDALMYAEPFWPKGTVFVSVVDPGVGTKRRAIDIIIASSCTGNLSSLSGDNRRSIASVSVMGEVV